MSDSSIDGARLKLTRILLMLIPASVVLFMPLDLLSGAQQTPGLVLSRVLFVVPFVVAVVVLPKLSERGARRLFIGLSFAASVAVTLMVWGTGGINSPAFSFTWALPLAIGLLFMTEPACPLVSGMVSLPLGAWLVLSEGKPFEQAVYWVFVTLTATIISTTASLLYRRIHRAERDHQAWLNAQLVHSDRMSTLGTLTAGVAHELNNPLTCVVLNLSLVQDRLPPVDDETVKPSLDEAMEAANRLQAIIKDLKAFSRFDADESTRADLHAAISSSLSIARSQLRDRVEAVTTLDEVGPVVGSESRLSQVFLNLLINAVQAMPNDRAHKTIRITTRRLDEKRVMAEVKDNGAGIPPEVLPHIFDPFYTTKAKGIGTGLGLWISQGIVRATGGNIEVESVPGEGTTFRVILNSA